MCHISVEIRFVVIRNVNRMSIDKIRNEDVRDKHHTQIKHLAGAGRVKPERKCRHQSSILKACTFPGFDLGRTKNEQIPERP